jgi:hypothetical protein
MKQYSEKYDDPKFTRMMIRDVVLLIVAFTASFIITFLAPFIAYLGQKYDW